MLSFEPVEFLRRLVPLIPPPFAHLVRHYGLLAPNARHRDLLPAAPVSWTGIRPESLLAAQARQAAATAPHGASTTASSPSSPEPTALPPAATTTSDAHSLPAGPSCQPTAAPCSTSVAEAIASGRPRRQTLPWAELLRRVFSIELVCPRCAGPLTVIAYLTAAPVLHKILEHLGLPTAPPALGPARDWTEQLDLFDADDEQDIDAEPPRRSGRGPPASTGPLPTAGDWVVELDLEQTDNDWGA